MSTLDLARHLSAAPSRVLGAAAGLARSLVWRRQMTRLRDLDDHLLEDIGVTRAEVEFATRLPFTHDAAEELRRRSLERRREREAALRRRGRS